MYVFVIKYLQSDINAHYIFTSTKKHFLIVVFVTQYQDHAAIVGWSEFKVTQTTGTSYCHMSFLILIFFIGVDFLPSDDPLPNFYMKVFP